MLIHSAVITGSVQLNNTDVSSITNVAGFATTSSVDSLVVKTGSYATTGSNQFNGNQSISGSITSNGTITAQTLVVQTVTSSIEFVTGSTRNGSLLANTHQFTGSLFQTGSTAAFMGNVGVGVTPSAWASSFKVIDMLQQNSIATENDALNITLNAFYDTGWKYKATGKAQRYVQNDGIYYWFNAPSGTAGNAITFSQAMTLDASGRLGIGTTIPNSTLAVNGNTSITGSVTSTVGFTGSLSGSATAATSASYAATSSFANNFKVNDILSIDSASLDYQQNLTVTTGSFQSIVSVATGSFRAAIFDYVTFSGSVARAGTLYSTWGGSSVEWFENYTADVNGSTTPVTLQAALSGGNIQLQAGISGSSWAVRSLVRLL